MTDTMRRGKKQVDPDWKKKVASVLESCGLVEKGFTGALRLSMTSGGVGSFTKEETFR
jgi:hypothetical protein